MGRDLNYMPFRPRNKQMDNIKLRLSPKLIGISLFIASSLCVFQTSCSKRNTSEDAPSVIRLFDILEEEDLVGNVSLSNAGWERTLWRAGEISPWQEGTTAAIRFKSLNNISGLQVNGNSLDGAVSGAASVLQFSLGQNRGGASLIKYIDVRMKVSGAGAVWLKPDGDPEVETAAQVAWAGSDAWNISQDVSNAGMRIYRFDVTEEGAPEESDGDDDSDDDSDDETADGVEEGDLRHFYLSFRDSANASFSIDSIRFVSEKEDGLNKTSGQQWSGLAEIYKETLAAKSSETFRIPLRELPARPWLDIAIGTPEEEPVTFTASIAQRDGSKTSDMEVLFERTVSTANTWEPLRIDLAEYSGEGVVLELSLSGSKKGLWGYWGGPAIRSSIVPEPGKKPQGVIFLVVDTLRTDHLNIFGYERETTTHLKQFAEEGVAFSNAVAQGTWTKVSQSSMVTSLYPQSHQIFEVPHTLPASAETIAEVYREAGYATVSYSSVLFTGKQNNMHQGYEELHEKKSIDDEEFTSKTSKHYVDRIIPWLEQHKDVPFFAYLHVFDPHSPYRPRAPYDTVWARPEDQERMQEIEKQMAEADVKLIHKMPMKEEYVSKTGNDPDELLRIYTDWYDGSIVGMDNEIGRLLDALKGMGIDDDTLIVFASDHGEELWEHGRFFHSHTVYSELSQVPLVFRWPNASGFQTGSTVDRVIENLDIMPTLLELSGIDGPSAMQGRSLLPLIDGSGASSWQDRMVFTQTYRNDDKELGDDPEKGHHFAFTENGVKVIRKEIEPELVEEFYDRTADPLDGNNIIDEGDNRNNVAAMTESFSAWREKADSETLPSDEEMAQDLSSEDLKRLKALGYVGGGVETKSDDDSDDN